MKKLMFTIAFIGVIIFYNFMPDSRINGIYVMKNRIKYNYKDTLELLDNKAYKRVLWKDNIKKENNGKWKVEDGKLVFDNLYITYDDNLYGESINSNGEKLSYDIKTNFLGSIFFYVNKDLNQYYKKI